MGVILPETEFLVGRDVDETYSEKVKQFIMPLATLTDPAVRFVYQMMIPATGMDAFLDRMNVWETQTPWSATTIFNVPAPIDSLLLPFIAVAEEDDSRIEDIKRMGIGAGIMWVVGKNASIGTSLLYFDGGSGPDDSFAREARLVARFQLEF